MTQPADHSAPITAERILAAARESTGLEDLADRLGQPLAALGPLARRAGVTSQDIYNALTTPLRARFQAGAQGANGIRSRTAAARTVAQAQEAITTPTIMARLLPSYRQALHARVEHPDATLGEIATTLGVTKAAYSRCLARALTAAGVTVPKDRWEWLTRLDTETANHPSAFDALSHACAAGVFGGLALDPAADAWDDERLIIVAGNGWKARHVPDLGGWI